MLVQELGWEQAVMDTRLAAEELRLRLPSREQKIAAIGFCWGGSLAWLGATRLRHALDASVCYYGRAIWDFKQETPEIPTLLHYGESDHSIPLSQVNEVRAAHPNLPVFIYKAGHGFHCDARKDFNPEAAREADQRTMEFLRNIFR
jgi:carboxymethylenebutenolidase